MLKPTKLSLGLAIAFGSLAVAPQFAAAQDKPATFERVTVTGSNIKRSEKEGTSPIETITLKDIRQSGAKTVLDLMKQIPSMGTDGYNDTASQNGFSKGVATASLRSLGATSTLILLNGRRLTPSAYANPNNGTSTLYDLNSIPVSALERIDIFKDGASAVYGSDAIGGVINFITKSDYQGFEISARVGANDDRQFLKRGANLAAGFGDFQADGYNVLFSADISSRNSTSIRDGSNDIRADDYAAINFRLNPYNSSISSQPFFYRERTPGSLSFVTGATVVNRTNCDPSRLITGGAANNITGGSLLGRTFCNYDTDQFAEAQSKGDDASFMSRGTLRINGDTSAFAEAGFSQSKRTYLGASRTTNAQSGPTTNFLSNGLAAPFQAVLPIGHPDNPFTDVRAALAYRFENIPFTTDLTNKQTRLLAGVKGTVGTWDWETAALWNRSDRDEVTNGFIYLPTLRKLLTGTPIATLAVDPTITRPVYSKGIADILQYDAKVSTEFGNLAGGPIGFAAGVEIRRESLRIDPDPANAAGEILGLSNTIIDGSRDVRSAFFEFRTPFLKTFEMDFAGRFDSYPGIATNFVPKVGSKWTVTEGLALRGTYAKGFRAPAVSQVTPGGAQFFLNNTTDPIRCPNGTTPAPGADNIDCNKSISGVGGANPNLTPETSKSFSFGMIYSPTSSVDLLVDWYKIRKEGEVALVSGTTVLEHPERFPADAIKRDTNPANLLKDGNGNPIPGSGPLLAVSTPWTNQGSTEVSGVDVELKIRNSLGEFGQMSSSLKAAYILSYKRADAPGDAETNVVGTAGGISDWATSSGAIPRVKLEFASSLTNGPHTFTGAMHYVSKIDQNRYTDSYTVYTTPACHYGGPSNGITQRSVIGTSPNGYIDRYPDCTVESWTTFDLGYYYTGVKDLTLGLHIANVFDTKAPYYPGINSSTTVLDGYNSGLHNPYGRYFTLSASYKFK